MTHGQNVLVTIIKDIENARAREKLVEQKDLNRIRIITKAIREASAREKFIEQSDATDLESKILKIRNAYRRQWEEETLPRIKSIIKSIDLKKGIPLPILSICGKGTQEIRFTKYLAYFLDSAKNHGLGDRLLQELVKDRIYQQGLNIDTNKSYEVVPELYIGKVGTNNFLEGCIVDIGIIGEDYSIFIEQKILSSENVHHNLNISQLEKYNIALENDPKLKDKKIIKIFLTPSSKNKYTNGWATLTHQEIVEKGIRMLKSDDLSRQAKENLSRLLIDLVTGPYERTEESLDEIVHIGNKLISDKFNLNLVVRFNRLAEEYMQLIEILMEVQNDKNI